MEEHGAAMMSLAARVFPPETRLTHQAHSNGPGHPRAFSSSTCSPCPSVSRREWLGTLVGTSLTMTSTPSLTYASPGPEFESVVFPLYPGFVTLPSGVQVRDICVGEGPEALGTSAEGIDTGARGNATNAVSRVGDARGGVVVTLEWGLWTVHQGRVVTPLLPPRRSSAERRRASSVSPPASAPASPADEAGGPGWSPETVRFALGDGSVIPAVNEALAVGGMRVGGIRRILVPPKASVSYPYVPLPEGEEARTKYGFAPTYSPALGVQSLTELAAGPVPSDPEARDWLEYVIRRNAFTIKPTDRSLLFDVRLVSVSRAGSIVKDGGGGSSDRGVRGEGWVGCRPATIMDQIGAVNDKSTDGGASWWTAALPSAGDYCARYRQEAHVENV